MHREEEIRLLKELKMVHAGADTYDMRLNWKLAIDTFGGTYHFGALPRNTLAQNLYGNAQCYGTFGRNEPALHHDHDTDRAELGIEPLPLIEG